jgi:hypothetical protein
MNILGQVYAGRDVALDVWHGGIVDTDGDGFVRPSAVTPDNADIFAGRNMSLTAHFVGSLSEPVELIARGRLRLDSHLPYAPPDGKSPWVVINGSVGGGALGIDVDKDGVPGLVLYNGQLAWGPWWTARQFQLTQRAFDGGAAELPWFLQPGTTLFTPSAAHDDLRPAEEKRMEGGEEEIPAEEPRTVPIGLPVAFTK